MNPLHRSPLEQFLAIYPFVLLTAIFVFFAWQPETLKIVEMKDLVIMIVTWLLAKGNDIVAYFFGSSKGSAMASQALVEQADKNADRAANVAATVAATAAAVQPLGLTPDMQVKDMHVETLTTEKDK